jgi:predicted 2-oxoglutarate/Fe(II)-dependent dioxygenase YbiX
MNTIFINGLFPGELTPSTTVGGCIDIFENVWPNPKETIKLLEDVASDLSSNSHWKRAETIGHGAFQESRTNSVLDITHSSLINNNSILQNVHNQFNLLLLAATIPYCKRYKIEEPLYHEGYLALKYKENQEYRSHYDGNTSVGRIISALVYLNSDYDGGELEFPNFKIKIKPEPGMLILFPSNFAYSHIAHPVTLGTKYSLVTWIKDREK